MAVTIEVKSRDSCIKVRRESLACSVLREFGDSLPEFRLLAFFDEFDWAEIKLPCNYGPENRGFYTPIRKKTFQGYFNLPQGLAEKIFGTCDWVPDGERFFDHLIYLHGTTCSDETGLVMTYSHELQHFAQYGFKRKLWAAGRLIPNLPKAMIDGLRINWPDIPHEREARIVAKRVAVRLFGTDVVKQYIERKISETNSVSDAGDWRFSLGVDPSIQYDLFGETKKVFQRWRACKRELENVLQEFRSDPNWKLDYQDINLSEYLDTADEAGETLPSVPPP